MIILLLQQQPISKIERKSSALINLIYLVSGFFVGVTKRQTSFIIENKATESWKLTFLPHKYRPLPHRGVWVMASPPHFNCNPFVQQWPRRLSPTPTLLSLLLPLAGSAPPHRAHQRPLYRTPTATWLRAGPFGTCCWGLLLAAAHHNLLLFSLSLL